MDNAPYSFGIKKSMTTEHDHIVPMPPPAFWNCNIENAMRDHLVKW